MTRSINKKTEIENQIKAEEKDLKINEENLKKIETGMYFLTFSKTKAGQDSKRKEIAKIEGNIEWCKERIENLKQKLTPIMIPLKEKENTIKLNTEIRSHFYNENPSYRK